jgi:ribosomal-protein-alanine N-acetyltransferase
MARALSTVELLGPDVVAIAQCVAIDADVFPYPSADFVTRSPSNRVWIARDEGRRVVAFLAARVHRDEIHVQGIAVDPSARRRGLGRALIRACLESDVAASRSVDLAVSLTNRAAIALYQAEGFEIVSRARNYYGPGTYGGQRDAYVMRRMPPARKAR